ncbi:MAG: class I SAM-dependent methyltransferase [Chloroflexi bacterium]|nr:MAG: class I SAM-dependent methyltransferase [Chloroflexota bacterium]
MSTQYNQATAFHYASYRPPLHSMILEYVLSSEDRFNNGLDVGCGTGYSAIALSKYCEHVYGVEPSLSMLEKASPHHKITYQQGSGADLPLPDKSIDVVTFAGSLFYAKSDELVKELKRVYQNQAVVIPYDFEVLLDDVLRQFGIRLEETASDYDHTVNLSGCEDFQEMLVSKERINLEVTPIEMAHLLLASSPIYQAIVKNYNTANPFSNLVKELEENETQHYLKANIFFSKYLL